MRSGQALVHVGSEEDLGAAIRSFWAYASPLAPQVGVMTAHADVLLEAGVQRFRGVRHHSLRDLAFQTHGLRSTSDQRILQ